MGSLDGPESSLLEKGKFLAHVNSLLVFRWSVYLETTSTFSNQILPHSVNPYSVFASLTMHLPSTEHGNH
jgi:hypothetical protein